MNQVKNQNQLNDKFASFNNQYVKEGDYIEFWAKAPDRMFLTGNVIDKVNNHDYTKVQLKNFFKIQDFILKQQVLKLFIIKNQR